MSYLKVIVSFGAYKIGSIIRDQASITNVVSSGNLPNVVVIDELSSGFTPSTAPAALPISLTYVASTTDALAGQRDDVVMTPLKVAQVLQSKLGQSGAFASQDAVTALAGSVSAASAASLVNALIYG